ncbi:MAG: FtsX-like permease family protein [Planctomycetes bacterium]|nr:FtsX-like permease family protein [Planctomycetota bacterium]
MLTLLSLASSVFLVANLEAALIHLERLPRRVGGEERLIVHGKASLRDRLPRSYLDRIRNVPEVTAAVPLMWFGGIYKRLAPENRFAQYGIEAASLRAVIPELEPIDPATRSAAPQLFEEFAADRSGALAGIELFEKFGWKLGDRIMLSSILYPVDLGFTLRCSYDAGSGMDSRAFYFHWEYLEESLGNPGFVNGVMVRGESPQALPDIIDRIDGMFANSATETHTETETALRAGFIQMLGNLQFLVNAIGTAVGFAMLMVSANTMAMAARERTSEIAVMKAIGFAPSKLLQLLLSEAAVLGFLGSLLGMLCAAGLAPLMELMLAHTNVGPLFAGYRVGAEIALMLIPAGIAIALLAAILPVWNVIRRPILTAIAHGV